MTTTLSLLAKSVKQGANSIANSSITKRNEMLLIAARKLHDQSAAILMQNQKDIDFAKTNSMSVAMTDRLTLSEARIASMVLGLQNIAALPDPLNRILRNSNESNGLNIRKITVPLGTLLVIYEARPNVTIDAAALALKSGNGIILRGSSNSLNSNRILSLIMKEALHEADLNSNAIGFVDSPDRNATTELLAMDHLIDVVIPRGGKGLIEEVTKVARMPIFKHLDGNCHTYIHQGADEDKAIQIVLNAKMRRTAICGATESLVIDRQIAQQILPKLVAELLSNGCEIRGDAESSAIDNRILEATEEDFFTEYLAAIISVKIVDGLDRAINHINHYGSHHTDAIITEDREAAQEFFAKVDSAILIQNGSTQFADGAEFGLGAEIGISTGKLHARGPVGLEELTTYKYLVTSECAIRK